MHPLNRHNRRIICRLQREYGGQVIPYRDLPRPAQLAMAYFMAIDGQVWRTPDWFDAKWNKVYPDEIACRKVFERALPHFIRRHGLRKFGYVVIPMNVLEDAVMACSHDEDFPDNFAEYHRRYTQIGNGMNYRPSYNRRNPWPVILDSTGNELFKDGWHRFHRYVDLGLLTVPCLYLRK
jgi:hypothetical protein